MALDRGLHGKGLVHDHHRERDEGEAQRDQRQREPPIERQRGWQQQSDKHECGEMFAKERDPEPPQRVGAAEHHLNLPAGMRAGMIGEWQLQHVLEIIRQDYIAPTVGEPVGEPGNERAGGNDEQPKSHPGANERRQHPCGGLQARRQRTRERVDYAPQQYRFDELRAGQRDIRQRQRDREPRIRP